MLRIRRGQCVIQDSLCRAAEGVGPYGVDITVFLMKGTFFTAPSQYTISLYLTALFLNLTSSTNCSTVEATLAMRAITIAAI